MTAKAEARSPALATNRKARHLYHILDSWEAGLALAGPEVKSCRAGQASLAEAHAALDGGELFVYGMRIQPYAAAQSGFNTLAADRPRKVLMHRRELDRLAGTLQLKGYAVVPLKLYLARGRIKIELGLGKGKLLHDKRETLRRKTADREAAREMRK
ncbi:MAG: SsrA-binding protein SmpB [Kiritimatiellae bacterium]|jgi:SsrA-binding protein|nr:SsrA-binding protein SmpB [Kiritimatiellia bacterium]NLD89950.1 SsrA-binding protein SmpB [Lentisphaerota bacterium]HPC20670.1 SsrA-binding protein SmpB [Kiritimatiellia bacterium]HQN79988.1 SsrA-binding protein SmpB [Kiritimatiellia bacterium]HQQ59788.1 SsrA-binding protein SmpB [Kiritimatiellia bacterium]